MDRYGNRLVGSTALRAQAPPDRRVCHCRCAFGNSGQADVQILRMGAVRARCCLCCADAACAAVSGAWVWKAAMGSTEPRAVEVALVASGQRCSRVTKLRAATAPRARTHWAGAVTRRHCCQHDPGARGTGSTISCARWATNVVSGLIAGNRNRPMQLPTQEAHGADCGPRHTAITQRS